jgi:acetyl esterase/lipase
VVIRALALVGLAATACSGTMEDFFAQDVVDSHLDLPYVPGTTDPRQHLDLFAPRGASGYPVVVFVHGGFWIHQDKDYFQPVVGLYRNVGIALARRGIGTAVIDYRLVPDVTFDEQFDDCAQAIRWVHDHVADYRGDPDRIVLAGHSAGGHIAALAAFDDARLTAAGVDVTALRGYAAMSPILDLAQFAASGSADAPIATEVFGDQLAAYSPSTYFHAGGAPVLIMLGERDQPFLLDQVPPAVAQLAALGAPATFAQIAGATHDDIVLQIDGDPDRVTPVLADFIAAVTQ